MKERLAKLFIKLAVKLVNRSAALSLMNDEVFPGKFLAISVLNSAEELEMFRQEQEMLEETMMEREEEMREGNVDDFIDSLNFEEDDLSSGSKSKKKITLQ